MSEKTLTREYLYKGKVLNLRLDRVELENGHPAVREIVEHPGAVVIVALDEAKRVLLVRQYRKAVERNLLELPAGTLDKPGETPEAAARRELEEETGHQADEWEWLLRFYSSPGILQEEMQLFLAQGLRVTAPTADEDEILTLERVPLAEALDRIAQGEICDAKTVIGLIWVAQRLGVRG